MRQAAESVGDVERIKRAFLHVESRGNPCAVSPSGTFRGAFQMGPAAAKDVGISDPDVLVCNMELAEWAWRAYMRRYQALHEWRPEWAALVWKGGPGTAKRVAAAVASGVPFDEAAERLGPHRTVEYLRLFRAAYRAAEGS
jgi:hypothetical protein